MRGRSRHAANKRKELKSNKQEDSVNVLHPQSEIQGIDRSAWQHSAKTPADDPNAKKSPPSCLRRRQKKAKSRADILNTQDGQEYDIIQWLDFAGCSSDEDEDSCSMHCL
jgi:hypothetical protein